MSEIRIKYADLQDALKYLEINSKELDLTLRIDNTELEIRSFDRMNQGLIIKLYEAKVDTLPKVTTTQPLRNKKGI